MSGKVSLGDVIFPLLVTQWDDGCLWYPVPEIDKQVTKLRAELKASNEFVDKLATVLEEEEWNSDFRQVLVDMVAAEKARREGI